MEGVQISFYKLIIVFSYDFLITHLLNPQFVFVVMLDTPKKSKDYYYKYRHRNGGWKGTLYNTAGWTSVGVAGKVIDKIGPILATKYIEVN